jgi:hypothetical protein
MSYYPQHSLCTGRGSNGSGPTAQPGTRWPEGRGECRRDRHRGRRRVLRPVTPEGEARVDVLECSDGSRCGRRSAWTMLGKVSYPFTLLSVRLRKRTWARTRGDLLTISMPREASASRTKWCCGSRGARQARKEHGSDALPVAGTPCVIQLDGPHHRVCQGPNELNP